MKSENHMKLRKSKLALLDIYDLCSNFDSQSWICCKNGSIFTNTWNFSIFSNVISINNLVHQSVEPEMQDGNDN